MKTTKNSLKKITLGLAFCAGLYFPNLVSAQQSNFSGRWVINTSKSEFGNVPAYAAVKQFEIKQNGSALHISRINVNANNEEKTSVEDDVIDNKPQVIKLSDQLSKENTLNWMDNGHSLITVSKYVSTSQPDKGYTLTQTWTLRNGGSELEVDLKSPTYTIKAIYDKQ